VEVVTPALAFRLGARATDVEIALEARDTTALQLVGAELLSLVSQIDGGAGTAAQYRAILATNGGGTRSERREAATGLNSLLGESPWFDLGAWAEASRVAAVAGNLAFLARESAALDRITERVGAEAGPRTTAVREITAELREGLRSLRTPEDLGAVRTLLGQLIAVAGG
jgi:hypothetical protein